MMYNYVIYILISFIVSVYIYIKGFISSSLVAAYVGNNNATSGLNNIGDYYSTINFGEIKSSDFWLSIPIFIYKNIIYLGINPQIFHSLSIFIFIFISMVGIELLIKNYNKSNYKYSVLISLGYTFSTFSIINFVGASIFVYIYWMIPLSIYVLLKKSYWGYFIYYLLIGLASAVNLPFGLMLIVLGIIVKIIFQSNNIISKENFTFLIFGILISFIFIFPNIFFFFSSKEAANSILSSEIFYRNGTNIITFIRGITDWGFFSGNNGYLYRNYSPFYNTLIGYFTSLWIFVPIFILILNKSKKNVNNIIMVGLIIFLSFLILGEVTQISNVFTNIFYSIPLSSIFRNTSKFFFLIYVLILLLLIYNKNIKIPSILFFIASIPTLIIFLSGNVITSNITKSNIPSDYKILNNEELISKNDNILVYPPQYFPVYNFGNGIKQFGSSSLLELFIDGNFIQSRCVGCGNKRFELDLKNLTNFRLLNWVNKLEEYGVNKIIYDDNTDKNFYRNTISRLELEEELLIQGILVNTNQIGNIYIYNLILDSKKLSVCNSFWIDGDTNLLVEDCKNGEVYFTPSSNDYLQIQKVGKYHIYFVLFIINILIIIGGLQSYYKYRKKNA